MNSLKMFIFYVMKLTTKQLCSSKVHQIVKGSSVFHKKKGWLIKIKIHLP